MTVYAWDIASAYPYAMAQLPCLRHGRWKLYKGRPLGLTLALVSWQLSGPAEAWGPLPVRLPDGNIVFPSRTAGGWAWSPEYHAARRLVSGVHALQHWAWEPKACKCPPWPFRERVVAWYCERLKWGKASKGLTLRLGLNSCYGKSAQGVGRGKFRCMVRAGLITAICRAQLLDAIGCASDPWNVVAVATDSVMATERLKPPAPLVLGTEEAARAAGKTPLGGWEEKRYPHGVFLVRPGLRFALGDGAVEADTAARGLGVRVLHANRARVLRAWTRHPLASLDVQQPAVFHGAKSSIRLNADGSLTRSKHYGKWEKPKPRKMGYEAVPKRESVSCGPGRDEYRLNLWDLDMVSRSVPYSQAARGALALASAELGDLEDEQPEGWPLGGVGG